MAVNQMAHAARFVECNAQCTVNSLGYVRKSQVDRRHTINASKNERAELIRYLVSGFSAVGTDLITYALLLKLIGPNAAKAASFISAMCVAYSLNKFWTFKAKTHSWSELTKFFCLYGSTLMANVIVNRLVINYFPQIDARLTPYTFQMGWLIATGVSTVLNYIGQKFWVFRRPSGIQQN